MVHRLIPKSGTAVLFIQAKASSIKRMPLASQGLGLFSCSSTWRNQIDSVASNKTEFSLRSPVSKSNSCPNRRPQYFPVPYFPWAACKLAFHEPCHWRIKFLLNSLYVDHFLDLMLDFFKTQILCYWSSEETSCFFSGPEPVVGVDANVASIGLSCSNDLRIAWPLLCQQDSHSHPRFGQITRNALLCYGARLHKRPHPWSRILGSAILWQIKCRQLSTHYQKLQMKWFGIHSRRLFLQSKKQMMLHRRINILVNSLWAQHLLGRIDGGHMIWIRIELNIVIKTALKVPVGNPLFYSFQIPRWHSSTKLVEKSFLPDPRL